MKTAGNTVSETVPLTRDSPRCTRAWGVWSVGFVRASAVKAFVVEGVGG